MSAAGRGLRGGFRPLRVLVLAYYFPPVGGGGVNRILKTVRALSEAGHEPWVLTVDAASWRQDPSLLAEVPAAARVLRLPNPEWGRVPAAAGVPGQSGLGRGRLRRWLVPDLNIGWGALAAAASAGFAAAGAIDAVLSSGPPYSAHLAALPARRLGLPFLADFRDAWTFFPGRQEFPPWRRALETRLEARVLERADRVFFASPDVRARMLVLHPGLEARSETLLTGFDPDECAPARHVEPPGDRLCLVHAGTALGDERGPMVDRLLAALAELRRRSPRLPIELAFLGGEAGLAERIRAHGVADVVRVESALPRRELPARLARAHRCVYLASAGALGGELVPGKLFDAAGADRRLLALAPAGAVTRLLGELDLGEAFAPEDHGGLLAHLTALARDPERWAARPGKARERLSARASAARIVAGVEQACRRSSGLGRPARSPACP